ncbi:hypothetical protein [Paraburkholderia sp.]|uniref:hypothetical protein n=1 Tax=Paraburkholderia sp. TaxID=1926495 RepID=UPI0039E55831
MDNTVTIRVTGRKDADWFEVEWSRRGKDWAEGWVRDQDLRTGAGIEDRNWDDQMIVGCRFTPFDFRLVRYLDPGLDEPEGYGSW